MTSSSPTTECLDFESRMLDAAGSSLRKALNSRVGSVRCSVEAGCLVLSGQLPNWHHKQLAQEAVKGIAGIGRVSNQIRVEGSTTSQKPSPVPKIQHWSVAPERQLVGAS